jgi:hypothetical protein
MNDDEKTLLLAQAIIYAGITIAESPPFAKPRLGFRSSRVTPPSETPTVTEK